MLGWVMRFGVYLVVTLLLGCVQCATPVRQIPLHEGWTLSNVNGYNNVSIAVNMPGYVHMQLLENGVLSNGHPYYRYNERFYRWIANDNWTLSVSIPSPGDGAQYAELWLANVDTVAEVRWDGSVVDNLKNRHLETFIGVPVGGKSAHKLEIHIQSAVQAAADAAAAYPYEVPYNPYVKGIYNMNFLRKAQSDFGWDWGPAFGAPGIATTPYLWVYDSLETVHTLVDVSVTQEWREIPQKSSGGRVALHVCVATRSLEFVSPLPSVHLTVTYPEEMMPAYEKDVRVSKDGKNYLCVVNEDIPVMQPRSADDLWWPHTMHYMHSQPNGDSHLCAVTVKFSGSGSGEVTKQVGLRSVELVTDTVKWGSDGSNEGETFSFSINGYSVFMKGANMIPLSAFHVIKERSFERLVEAAVDASMNMLRVWGGGIYQPTRFYDICDQKGIMLWQEIMFACALYPADKAFLNSVTLEVRQNVRRLSSHASVVIYGGNNENEQAWTNIYPLPARSPAQYTVDYWRLYIETVRSTLKASDPFTPFVDASPSNGLDVGGGGGSSGEGYQRKPWAATVTIDVHDADVNAGVDTGVEVLSKRWGNVHSSLYGDNHFYDYKMDCLDAAGVWNALRGQPGGGYPNDRFVSEHGVQSVPSLHSWQTVSKPEDLTMVSDLLQYRQRHPSGWSELQQQLQMHFPVRNLTDGDSENFALWCYLIQLHQSMCYSSALTHWRSQQSTLNTTDGSGLTMGILYWQLNDVWPGPSWSSLNSDFSWKVTHYAVKRAYAPVIASGEVTMVSGKAVMQVSVTSEVLSDVKGSVLVELWSWDKGSVVQQNKVDFFLDGAKAQSILTVSLTELDATGVCTKPGVLGLPRCYVRLTGEWAAAALHLGNAIEDSFVFLTPKVFYEPQLTAWVDPQIIFGNFTYDPKVPNTVAFDVAVSGRTPAQYVYLSAGDIQGSYSDNAFFLKPSPERRRISFVSNTEQVNLDRFKRSISAVSLFDVMSKLRRK